MLKVLLVDDEPIVRQGLKTIINWKENGFYICGEAIDGKDGLNKILSLKPDLVLMDIRMPGIHGIEAIQEAKKNGYNGKFIILSGYSDFKYAQSAVKLGVSSYILKPIDEIELEEVVKSVHIEIYNNFEQQKCIDKGKKQLTDNILKNIVMNIDNVNITDLKIKSYNLNFNFDYFKFIIVDTIREEDFETISNYFCNSENADIFKIEDRPAIIFKGDAFIEEQEIMQGLYKKLSRANDSIFISLGRSIKKVEDLSISYKDAMKILKNKFFYEELKIANWENISKNENSIEDNKIEDISFYFEKIFIAIEIGDTEKIKELVRKLGDVFKKQKYSSEEIKGLCVNMLIGITEKAVSTYEELSSVSINKENIMRDIYDNSSFQKLLDYLSNEFSIMSTKICSNSSENTMKRILNYIEKNYYKDLKLEFLAEIFCYNSAYLGKMFKSYVGEGFNGYVDKVRMEKAKVLLLQGNLKVYQVSEKVGYKSIDYFYSKFKKYVGISPKEFKKL